MTTMTTFNNETFTKLFPRADVREYLRKECAKKNLTTMTEEEKDTLYNNCAKTVDADNNQISPKPKDQFKKADWVKENSIVIDVGINKVGDKIVGDVEFTTVKEKTRAITPVPGGVGPMTIACLLKNTLECFKGR